MVHGRWAPTGLRDMTSAALFFSPGIWAIRKRQRRVFSLMFLRRGLGMSSSALSLSIFRSGLWVDRNDQVVASQDEVACFIQGISYREGFTLNGGVPGLCRVRESAADQGYLPSISAAEGTGWLALAVLLE